MGYCEVADVRSYARGIDKDKVPDSEVQGFIDDATSEIDEYVGYNYLKTEDHVEYHDGDTDDDLILRNWPVLAITSVEKRGISGFEALTVFDPATGEGDYVLDEPGAGTVRWTSGARPTEGTQAIKATYDYGYESIPGYVKKLCALIAAIYTCARAAGKVQADGLVSINQGSLSLSWGGGPYQDTIGLLVPQADALLKEKMGRRLVSVPSL